MAPGHREPGERRDDHPGRRSAPPAGPRRHSDAVAVPPFVGDLVGDWRALIADAPVRTSIPADAVALDTDGSMIDWSSLDLALAVVTGAAASTSP